MRPYIGLDTATTMGFAFFDTEVNRFEVGEKKGSPSEQLQYILRFLDYYDFSCSECRPIFVMEQQHIFLNAKTTRSLLERYGFLHHTLIRYGYRVEEVSPKVARRFLGVKTKQDALKFFISHSPSMSDMTDNHSDAMAVAYYQAHKEQVVPTIETLTIERLVMPNG